MSPDFLPPARCELFPREKGKTAFVEGFFSEKAVFPFSRAKKHISRGVEHRGSLISVPLALRVFSDEKTGRKTKNIPGAVPIFMIYMLTTAADTSWPAPVHTHEIFLGGGGGRETHYRARPAKPLLDLSSRAS